MTHVMDVLQVLPSVVRKEVVRAAVVVVVVGMCEVCQPLDLCL